jgi:hypothetical protein
MFSVNEYYRFNKFAAKTTRHLQKFASLEDARACADDAYREISRIPESEAVWIGVLDEAKGAIVYSQPEKPFSETTP